IALTTLEKLLGVPSKRYNPPVHSHIVHLVRKIGSGYVNSTGCEKCGLGEGDPYMAHIIFSL
ncbi:MAG: hypothetical protein HY073_05845, partial [Deltaproteobacteria bacterium]|nr:hypothetical protein [Deltaproteobacteria bacterium]